MLKLLRLLWVSLVSEWVSMMKLSCVSLLIGCLGLMLLFLSSMMGVF